MLIQQVTEEVLEIIRKDKDIQGGNTQKVIDLVDKKVLPHFNFQHMTALAVGKDWRKGNSPATATSNLTQEFKTLLVRTYSNALDRLQESESRLQAVQDECRRDRCAGPYRGLQPGSKPVQLDYSLEKLDGGWKVYDVNVVAGISLVTNYRDQFGQEVRNGGIDGLIASISSQEQIPGSAIWPRPKKNDRTRRRAPES